MNRQFVTERDPMSLKLEPTPFGNRPRFDPMNRGEDSSRILLGEFLPTRQVEGFTVDCAVLNDPHFQSFCFDEFDVSCGSCFMAGKRNLSRSSVPVGVLARDSQ